MAVLSELTPDRVAHVADALRADPRLTVLSACIDCGVSPGAVKSSLKRLRDGTGGEHVAPIARAVDRQCEELLRLGDDAAGQGSPTTWYSWRLEGKNPCEYGRSQKVDLTVRDEADLASMSLAELRAVVAAAEADGEE